MTKHRILAIFFAATALMLPAFLSGHIIGHSSHFNVPWSAGFAKQLFAGELYPRWLPDMTRGTGSPVFYFYGPLPFYLAAPFHLITEPRMAVMLGSWLMLALSGVAFCRLATAFVRSGPALFAAALYMAMPYHLSIDIWHRAAYGEQAAFIFIPLCLLCAFSLGRGWIWALGLAASYAGLVLSHLPSTVLFSPFLVGFCFWSAWRAEKPAAVLARAAAAAVLSGGLTSAYVVPALWLQDMIQADVWGIYRPAEHLLFNGSTYAMYEFLSLMAGAGVLVSAVAIWVTASSGRWRAVAPWTVISAAVLLLVTPASGWLWGLSETVDRVQFPWRALTIFDAATCMLVAVALDARGAGYRMATGIAVVPVFAVITAAFVLGRGVVGPGIAGLRPTPDALEDSLIAAHADALEYLPACRGRSVGEETTLVAVERDLRRARRIVDPRMPLLYYYPFLEVVADGARVEARCDRQTGFLIADIPDAAQTVEVIRRGTTAEVIGLAVSMTSLLVWIAGFVAAVDWRGALKASRR
ncbi:hypothetical protein JQK88_16695 [Mesorhizobium caraganae]|uniref:hypothetical protein n=1 Tax=Mesorhizobium caraganae TaxID=483206 RepID=UPI00193A8804|nr:hypothetical protein [Mesorhizobium caraganae]MBM2712833.1 hypothetical protein [Mesorhizobium caraganae]